MQHYLILRHIFPRPPTLETLPLCVTIRRVKRLTRSQILALLGLALTTALVMAFVTGLWVGMLTASFGSSRPGQGPLPVLDEAWTLAARDFYGELPPPEVRMRGAVRGLLETLADPYTVLLDPEPAQQEQQRLSGRYGSIGARLWWAEDGAIALAPHPAGPAAEAGVLTGDRLLAIAGERLNADESLDAVTRRLEGPVGTSLTLTLRRDGRDFTVTLTRAEVVQPSVERRMLEGAPEIGYLRIHLFTAETAQEMRQAVQELSQRGTRALVLDLRGNGGGMLADLDDVAGVFLPPDAVLYYDVRGTQERQVNVSGAQLFQGPLAVLVDGSTASAAEILAAALHDQERATLIGAPTFGKGSIQALYPLRDGSVLHVTHAVWLTPARVRLDGVGLLPDLPVEPRPGADATLEAAIAHLGANDAE